LALLNNRFLIRQSQRTAQRLEQTEPDLRARINQLFLLAYSRPVTEEEWMSLEVYVGKHGLANTCRMIMNSNEFLFVE
jgi:hypothetical protein